MLRALELPRRLPAEIDLSLLWSGLMLLFFGMVMVYSASMATAEAGKMSGYQPAYFLIRHAVFVTIGLVAAAAESRLDGVAIQVLALAAADDPAARAAAIARAAKLTEHERRREILSVDEALARLRRAFGTRTPPHPTAGHQGVEP